MSVPTAPYEVARSNRIMQSSPVDIDRLVTGFERFCVLHSNSGERREFESGVEFGRNGTSVRGYPRWILGGNNISRNHFVIYRYEDRLLVEDLGSTFGTKLNGHNVVCGEKEVTSFGDRIMLADLREMQFVISQI